MSRCVLIAIWQKNSWEILRSLSFDILLEKRGSWLTSLTKFVVKLLHLADFQSAAAAWRVCKLIFMSCMEGSLWWFCPYESKWQKSWLIIKTNAIFAKWKKKELHAKRFHFWILWSVKWEFLLHSKIEQKTVKKIIPNSCAIFPLGNAQPLLLRDWAGGQKLDIEFRKKWK